MKRILIIASVIAFVGVVLSSCGTREKCPAFSKAEQVQKANS